MEQQTIDIKNLIVVFVRRWKSIVAGLILGALAGYFISAYLMTPLYKTSFSLCVNTGEENVMVATSLTAQGIYQEQTASAMLATTYIVAMKSSETRAAITELLNTKYRSDINDRLGVYDEESGICNFTVGQVGGWISLSSETDTQIINVSVTTPDPELSKIVCDAVIDAVPPVLKRVFKCGDVEPFGIIQANYTPISPNKSRNAMLGGIVGIVLVIAIIFLVYLFDNRVMDEAEFSRRFDVPILGKIPDISEVKNGRDYKYYGKYGYGYGYGYGSSGSKSSGKKSDDVNSKA